MRTSVCIPNLLWVWGGFPDSSVGKGSACNAGYPGWIPGLGRCAGERIGYPLQYSWASLVALRVKNPSAMRETWVWSLGWKDPLEKGTAIPLQYSGLENSMDCLVHGVAKRWTRLSDTHSLTQFKPVSGGWAIALIALSSWVMHSAWSPLCNRAVKTDRLKYWWFNFPQFTAFPLRSGSFSSLTLLSLLQFLKINCLFIFP